MGLKIRYVDVGGGLGVDYDGTTSRNTFSTNYTPQEYANDVIYSIKAICDAEKISHPHIISESGRALTAHSSILIANVIDYTKPRSANSFAEPLSPKCTELYDMYNQLKVENCREYYHDTLYARREALNLFNMGYMTLEERSRIEELYWSIMEKINSLRKQHNLNYHEFDGLDKVLASTYVLNFSLFQSLPDCWAIDQVFPVVPIHRLNEKPDVFCSVADITCDSDGRVVHYIGDEEPSNILPLHAINPGEDYFIGFFLVGAYQEILGDLHNLFGDTNAVHITLDKDNQYRISHHIKGDTVNEVLSYLEYYSKELVELMRKKLEISVNTNKTSVEDAAHFLNYFESGLTGYTYLED
jgi:arginine decarboxylase